VAEVLTQQRRHDRYKVRISCELTISGQTFHAQTKNLSTGGAAIASERILSTGEVVTVSFFLTEDGIEASDGIPFECAASIRWTKPTGDRGNEAGLQFLSPSAEQRELLKEFLGSVA
jgi:c-di-GMP-binding flagellar brake protein YcgR